MKTRPARDGANDPGIHDRIGMYVGTIDIVEQMPRYQGNKSAVSDEDKGLCGCAVALDHRPNERQSSPFNLGRTFAGAHSRVEITLNEPSLIELIKALRITTARRPDGHLYDFGSRYDRH